MNDRWWLMSKEDMVVALSEGLGVKRAGLDRVLDARQAKLEAERQALLDAPQTVGRMDKPLEVGTLYALHTTSQWSDKSRTRNGMLYVGTEMIKSGYPPNETEQVALKFIAFGAHPQMAWGKAELFPPHIIGLAGVFRPDAKAAAHINEWLATQGERYGLNAVKSQT